MTVFDLGGFTRAAEALGRTQPAISLQMRRLEEIVNAKLITYVGRKLKLTEEGEFFMVYARQILCLNDEALVRVSRNDVAGGLCVGLPTDHAGAFFQRGNRSPGCHSTLATTRRDLLQLCAL